MADRRARRALRACVSADRAEPPRSRAGHKSLACKHANRHMHRSRCGSRIIRAVSRTSHRRHVRAVEVSSLRPPPSNLLVCRSRRHPTAASTPPEDNVLRYIVKRKEGEGGARAALALPPPPHRFIVQDKPGVTQETHTHKRE